VWTVWDNNNNNYYFSVGGASAGQVMSMCGQCGILILWGTPPPIISNKIKYY
jgi:hypothetical protein